MVDTHTHAYTV